MKYSREELQNKKHEIMDRWYDEWNETDVKPSWDYEAIIKELEIEWLMSMEVGDHAHICHYSDITPCTVIKKTATTITVRHDKARKSENWNPQYEVGGFSAHCINNNDQKDWWIIEDDPEGYVETFRFRKSSNRYMNSCDERLYPDWEYKYDYNF